jgi:low affinity Fe/Cu permease
LPNIIAKSPLSVLLQAVGRPHPSEMPILLILIVVLAAVGLGAVVGSASTWLVGALIGVAVALMLLTFLGVVVGHLNPPHREDGAPLRRSPR